MLVKIKKNFFVIISSFLILYFLINLLGGNRGFFAYIEKKEQLHKLKQKESNITNKIKDLRHKNSLLSDNLDEDYIDILIRDKLMAGKKGERTYIIKNNDN
tara:strand:- start:871 stop:1173 length:303 start_codon:yes stop_codon:yes gene_type:complete